MYWGERSSADPVTTGREPEDGTRVDRGGVTHIPVRTNSGMECALSRTCGSCTPSVTRGAWDQEAATFDNEPDHGLTTSAICAAWCDLLVSILPAAPACVADIGCGTGTLTRLLTDEGYAVVGLDFLKEMIERARAKVPEADFVVADAGTPPLAAGEYDVVLSRHVLWAMEDPEAAFAKWVALLKPGGTIALIEGNWSTGAGLTAAQVEQIVLRVREEVRVTAVTQSIHWGKEITDERYVAVSHR